MRPAILYATVVLAALLSVACALFTAVGCRISRRCACRPGWWIAGAGVLVTTALVFAILWLSDLLVPGSVYAGDKPMDPAWLQMIQRGLLVYMLLALALPALIIVFLYRRLPMDEVAERR